MVPHDMPWGGGGGWRGPNSHLGLTCVTRTQTAQYCKDKERVQMNGIGRFKMKDSHSTAEKELVLHGASLHQQVFFFVRASKNVPNSNESSCFGPSALLIFVQYYS